MAVVAVRSYSSREARNDRGSEPHIAVVFQGVDAAENGRGERDAETDLEDCGKLAVYSSRLWSSSLSVAP